VTQLPLPFEDSHSVRTRKARANPSRPLFTPEVNLDLHLHTSAEAIADVSGPDPEFAYNWLSRVVGPLRQVRARRFAFPTARLDLLLFVRPPVTVTMDAATIAVARSLYAQSMGLSPMNVTRHRQRLLGFSKSWPSALSVVDAPLDHDRGPGAPEHATQD
jgi:hypothetical protein